MIGIAVRKSQEAKQRSGREIPSAPEGVPATRGSAIGQSLSNDRSFIPGSLDSRSIDTILGRFGGLGREFADASNPSTTRGASDGDEAKAGHRSDEHRPDTAHRP